MEDKQMNKTNKWGGLLVLLLLGVLAGAVLITRQKSTAPDRSPAFLPGVYTCLAQNEFCRIADTLVIRRTNNTDDDYIVTRTTSFVRMRSGKRDPPEYQQQHWIGHYDAARLWLMSARGNDTVRYYPKENRVSQSDFYYEKIE